MNDTQLLDRLAATDRHPNSQPLPHDWSEETVLGEIGRRLNSDGYAPVYEPRRARTGWIVAVAAFAAVVVLGGGIGVFISRSPSFNTAGALATASDYFAAFNRGDADKAQALFANDALITIKPSQWGEDTLTSYHEWVTWLEWHAAQGSKISDAECRPTTETETSVSVACSYGMADVVRLAVGVPPTEVATTMVITPAGISRFESIVIDKPGPILFSPYHRWVVRNYPEDADAACAADGAYAACALSLDSIDEARLSGQIRALHAYGWAEFLEERDCAYPSWCFFRTPITGGE